MVESKQSGCASGCLTIVGVVVLIGFVGSFSENKQSSGDATDGSRATNSSPGNSAPSTGSASQACGKDDLQCWGDRMSIAAGFKCKSEVEGLAKYEFKWTDSWYEVKFGRFRWADSTHNAITMVGDKAMMSNGFGAFQRVRYECDMSVPGEEVLRVRASER